MNTPDGGCYTAVYPRPFIDQLDGFSPWQRNVIDAVAEQLERFPRLGRPSEHECPEMPFLLREYSINDLHHVLFYSVDDEQKRVLCWYLWDTRRNPEDMFTGFYVY